MKIDKLINTSQSKLLLFFAGWSASPGSFCHLETTDDTDLWICYDYRDLTFDEDLSAYREIRLVAWSLGVWVASAVFREKEWPFTDAIAINGTTCPIHDRQGIPEAIFRGTLENITEEGMHRFNRRMCGRKEILQAYEQAPTRPLDEIREELQYLYRQITDSAPDANTPFLWTSAFISSADRIFPTENLRAFWQGRCPVTEIEAPHYPFYLWKQWNDLWKQ